MDNIDKKHKKEMMALEQEYNKQKYDENNLYQTEINRINNEYREAKNKIGFDAQERFKKREREMEERD